jgi:hypothetical protein
MITYRHRLDYVYETGIDIEEATTTDGDPQRRVRVNTRPPPLSPHHHYNNASTDSARVYHHLDASHGPSNDDDDL